MEPVSAHNLVTIKFGRVAFPQPFRAPTQLSVRQTVTLGFAIMVLADNLAILRCPACGGMMKLVRSVPRPQGLSPLNVLSCTSCNEVEVREEKRVA
jgi:hypothetical protein